MAWGCISCLSRRQQTLNVTPHFMQNQFCVFSDVSQFKNDYNNEENNEEVDDYGHNDDDLLPSVSEPILPYHQRYLPHG